MMFERRDSSNITPRFLTVLEKLILTFPSVIDRTDCFICDTICGLPISINSDLSGFNFRKFDERKLFIIA